MAINTDHHPTASPQLRLAQVRERQGLSLEQIADTTKISIRFLRAIENEEFDKLPGGIFSTSYIRQYAGAIGYEESLLLELYRETMGLNSEPARKARAHTAARQSPLRWQRTPAAFS